MVPGWRGSPKASPFPPGAVSVQVRDLCQATQREDTIATLDQMGFDIDILINNAGIGHWKHFQERTRENLDRIIDLNVKGTTHLTRLVLPRLLSKHSGQIVNISSTAGFIGSPYGVCYAATKSYIRSFSDSLAMELRDSGVSVSCVFPGATATDFWGAAGMKGSFYDTKVNKMTTEAVAAETLLAIKVNKSEVVIGLRNKLNILIACHAPRWLLKRAAVKRFEG